MHPVAMISKQLQPTLPQVETYASQDDDFILESRSIWGMELSSHVDQGITRRGSPTAAGGSILYVDPSLLGRTAIFLGIAVLRRSAYDLPPHYPASSVSSRVSAGTKAHIIHERNASEPAR